MNQNQGSGGSRPAVVENLSTTQLDELERQYNEHDRSGWDTLTESYGWSSDDSKAVWTWFSERPKAGEDNFGNS